MNRPLPAILCHIYDVHQIALDLQECILTHLVPPKILVSDLLKATEYIAIQESTKIMVYLFWERPESREIAASCGLVLGIAACILLSCNV